MEDESQSSGEPAAAPAGPSELELRAARDLELATAAAAHAAEPAPAELREELALCAAAVAELEGFAGPPSEERTLELMDRLTAVGEAGYAELADELGELAAALVELANRERPKTAEELAAEELEGAADKAKANYHKRLRAIFGPDTELVECPACDGRGIGGAAAPVELELKTHPMFKECPGCGGATHVKTGAKVGDGTVVPCPDCKGRGYLTRLDAAAPPAAPDENGTSHEEWGVEPWLGDPSITPAAV